MRHPYQPQIPMMTIYATPNELIAVGTVISQYLTHYEHTPNPTREQLEMIALLRSFQGRIVSHIRHQSSRSSLEVQK